MSTQTGYEDKPSSSFPPPDESTWTVEHVELGESNDDTIYVRIQVDEHTVGLLRLPSVEHVRWLRERIQG